MNIFEKGILKKKFETSLIYYTYLLYKYTELSQNPVLGTTQKYFENIARLLVQLLSLFSSVESSLNANNMKIIFAIAIIAAILITINARHEYTPDKHGTATISEDGTASKYDKLNSFH